MATTTSAATPLSANTGARLDFIDALRGLVIVLMVLDHTRDFVHLTGMSGNPLDPKTTTPALYATRWITHLCAPTFVFLSGVSIFLQSTKGKTGWPLSRFLLTRGLWLVFLELTVVNFGFDFAPGIFLQVIWAIGVSMIFMAGMVWLPRWAVLLTGVAVVAGHNLLDGVQAQALGDWGLLWTLMMQPGLVPGGFAPYPVIPWFGVMCLGYGLGWIYLLPTEKRTRTLAVGAVAAIVLFFTLRLPNLYGNGSLWSVPADPSLTYMAVLDVTKYPPSLHYVLITLGISTLIGLALQRAPRLVMTPLLAFGRTPLLTYLLHVYVAHGLGLLIGVAMGFPAEHFFGHLSDPSRLIKDGWGLTLWQTYLVWLAALVILYPISSAYAKHRAAHKTWWHSYL